MSFAFALKAPELARGSDHSASGVLSAPSRVLWVLTLTALIKEKACRTARRSTATIPVDVEFKLLSTPRIWCLTALPVA